MVLARQTSPGAQVSDAGQLQHPLDAPPARLAGMTGLPDYLVDRSGLAITADGGYVITWVGATSDGQQFDIFVQRFDSHKVAVGGIQRLAGLPLAEDQGPQVTGLSDGGYVVTWQQPDVDNIRFDIFAQRFASNGALFGPKQELTGLIGDQHFYPSITSLHNGGYVISWTGINNADADIYDIYVQGFNAQNQPIGSVQRLTGMGGEIDEISQIKALPDGGYLVTWMGYTNDNQGRDIFVQRFDNTSMPVGTVQRLSGMSGQEDQMPVIAVLSDGAYVLSWMGYTIDQNWDIFVQRFDSSNNLVGSTQRLAGVYESDEQPQISALSNGSYVVSWTSRSGGIEAAISIQKYDANNAPAGSAHSLTGGVGSGFYNSQISGLSDGGYVVAWQGGGGVDPLNYVYLQRYDQNNQAVGVTRKFSGMYLQPSGSPLLTALPDGGYVLGWSGMTSDGQNSDIFVQQFDAQDRIVDRQALNLIVDQTGPLLVSGNPLDNALNVTLSGDIQLIFDKDLVLGSTGTITLKGLDGASDVVLNLSVPADLAQVSVLGHTLTINPTADLTPGKQYAVHLSAGAVTGLIDGNSLSAITNDTSFNFTTVGTDMVDLGIDGKLIAPVNVDGRWYYYWDRSGDGIANAADLISYNDLKPFFAHDVTGGTSSDIFDWANYGTLNGVQLKLPTLGGPATLGMRAGTTVDNSTPGQNNPTYNDLLAVWDEFNGSTAGQTNVAGLPSAWLAGSRYASSTFKNADSTHYSVDLSTGTVYSSLPADLMAVMVQIL
jgi:phenolic acid decarboxylase